jgi:hypothetical protein
MGYDSFQAKPVLTMGARVDIIGGGALVALALAALHQAADLETGTLSSFGPGMLPTLLAAVLLACGTALLIVGVVQKGPAVEYFAAAWRGPLLVGVAVLVFALTIDGMDFDGLAIPQLGLAVTGPITLILAGYGSSEASLRDLGAAGFGLTGFCLALFNDAIGMDIPVVPGAVEALLIDGLGTATTLRAAYLLCAAVTIVLVATRTRAASP